MRAILDKVTVVPGVESAAICDMLPLDRNRSWGMRVEGSTEKNGRFLNPFVYVVSPGYLGTMGMRLTSGRDLSWRAGPGAENEVVINEAAAREGWQGKDAVGRLVSGLAEKESRVVGVIADVHEISPETPSSPEVYLPMAQSNPEGAELVIKTRLPIEAVAPSVMAAVRSPIRTSPRPSSARLARSSSIPFHRGGFLPSWFPSWLSSAWSSHPWESTASSPTPSLNGRRTSASAWLWAPLPPACLGGGRLLTGHHLCRDLSGHGLVPRHGTADGIAPLRNPRHGPGDLRRHYLSARPCLPCRRIPARPPGIPNQPDIAIRGK